MSADKITTDELVAMFGSRMPLEGAKLILEAPPEETCAELRAKLQALSPPRDPVADDALVEAMRAIIAEAELEDQTHAATARALLPIIRQVRDDATEAAAVVADRHATDAWDTATVNSESIATGSGRNMAARDIAAAIRAGAKP